MNVPDKSREILDFDLRMAVWPRAAQIPEAVRGENVWLVFNEVSEQLENVVAAVHMSVRGRGLGV